MPLGRWQDLYTAMEQRGSKEMVAPHARQYQYRQIGNEAIRKGYDQIRETLKHLGHSRGLSDHHLATGRDLQRMPTSWTWRGFIEENAGEMVTDTLEDQADFRQIRTRSFLTWVTAINWAMTLTTSATRKTKYISVGRKTDPTQPAKTTAKTKPSRQTKKPRDQQDAARCDG
jgi:hypothetical protein